jgi:hypothetical protein
MDEHTFNKLAQLTAAQMRVDAMKAEMMVAVARGDNPPDYSNDIRWEAQAIEELWRR